MKFIASIVSTVALLGAAIAQQTSGDITVNSPASLVQCQPAALSWSGGTAPYIVAAIPGGQPSAAALTTISQSEQGNSLTWTVDLPANTQITIKLTDAKGSIQYSSPVTIQSGSDSCLNGASSSGSSGNSTSASTSSAASGAVAGTSASGASGAASSAVTSAASGAASKTTATSTAPTSTVTGSSPASGSAKPSGSPSGSASGSLAPSASSTGANSGALPNGIVTIPAVVFAALGAIFALF
ncbi:uncharacterized protein I206_104811 [Kwoniella pini CBS 10737]|uniref:Uncharacterized protein n=1 Tax=Kwoniella pini CBS 10737 TaxID=1296096 RepID=A0A1B9I7X6_9TREE|nr:uncharacterized protein I206_02350 [Kwoniella pini CBS 10737]OCF51635.1 hypothetical protein I206_02350 [Kwoniella pini CBS 10737]